MRLKSSERAVAMTYKFGSFHVDPAKRTLSHGGDTLHLPARAFDTLVALLEEHGHVVEKDLLVQRVWPDVAVGENNLAQSIAVVRRALGDSDRNGGHILTVPGRGYSFVADVEEMDATSRQRAARRYVTVAAALAAGTAAAAWLWRSDPPPAVSISLLTGAAGVEQMPAFSPDGRYLAYSWKQSRGDPAKLYVKVVGAGNPVRLTDGPAFYPAWSPDGRHIAYHGRPAGIYLIPALGGPPRKLTDAQPIERPAWYPDGKHLAFVDVDSATGFRSLYKLAVDTLERRLILAGESRWDVRLPAISPAGHAISLIRSPAGGVNSIAVMPLNGGDGRLLTSTTDRPFGLAWSADGRAIYYCSAAGGLPSLWRVDSSGGTRVPIREAGHDISDVASSANRSMLAIVRSAHPVNIWVAPLDGSAKPRKLAATKRRQSAPQFSPGGLRIAFESNRSGASEIWTVALDSDELVQATTIGADRHTLAGTPRWSHDGRDIVFDARPEGNADIFMVSAEGGPARRLTDNPAEDVVPSFSRDGQWVYFASRRTGTFEVWKVRRGGGEVKQVTSKGGFGPMESPDGSTLYYVKQGLLTDTLWTVPTAGGDEVQIPVAGRVNFRSWAVTHAGILHADSLRERFGLTSVPLDIAVSPDEQQVAFTLEEERTSSILVVEGLR